MILKYEVKRILKVHLEPGPLINPSAHLFCHQSSSPHKSKQEAVSLFTTSHSVKLHTKWKQARPSEAQQVIHMLCPCYSRVTVDSHGASKQRWQVTPPLGEEEPNLRPWNLCSQVAPSGPALENSPLVNSQAGWKVSTPHSWKKQYVARAVEPSG